MVRYQVDEVKIVIKPLCIPHLVQIAPQYPPRDRWAETERGAFPRIDLRINSNPPQFPHSTSRQTCDPVNYMSSGVLYEISHPEKAKGMLCDTILPWWFPSAPHLVGVNSVNWGSGSQLTFPRVGYLSPISTHAVLSTFSIAYFITSHYNSHQPILSHYINRYHVKQSDTLTIARIQTHQILNSFFGFLSRGYLFYFPPPLPFRGWFWKLLP